jgi:signal transduction histidine kinase
MNVRSIHFRLISWYTLLMFIICLAFGAYTYHGLSNRLYETLDLNMKRRTYVIGKAILNFFAERGVNYLNNEIQTIFSPEENSRFIRITDENGKVIYASGMPQNKKFNPSDIKPIKEEFTEPLRHEIKIQNKLRLITLASHFQTPNGNIFTIEVGDTSESINDTLHALLIELIFGLPFVILLATAGGYILIQNSLKHVENIRRSAENISLTNLKKRLPVTKTGDSIEHLSRTLNKMIGRMEIAYQQARQFSADASHELRTPLTIIRGELESVIMEPHLPGNMQERLGVILEETERLTVITEGLFAISRMDAGEAKMEVTPINLSHLAKTTLEHMKLLADEKNISVTCDAGENIEIEGDQPRLKQVIVNLLDNAIKYTPYGGKIDLKVYAINKKAIIEVVDNGIGISAEDKDKIFERFYRADKVRSRDLGGAGLGLSIIKSICAAHNAQIRVYSVEDKGSRFIIEIPAIA